MKKTITSIALILLSAITTMAQKNGFTESKNQLSLNLGYSLSSGDFSSSNYATGGAEFNLNYTRIFGKKQNMGIDILITGIANGYDINKKGSDVAKNNSADFTYKTANLGKLYSTGAYLFGLKTYFPNSNFYGKINIGFANATGPQYEVIYNDKNNVEQGITIDYKKATGFAYRFAVGYNFSLGESWFLNTEMNTFGCNFAFNDISATDNRTNVSIKADNEKIKYETLNFLIGIGKRF